jgi:hypothetical protein
MVIGKNYLKEEFYLNSYSTIDVLNKLYDAKLMRFACYESGKVLSVSADRKPETIEIISKVILDLNRYELESSKYLDIAIEDDRISLTHLVIIHEETHIPADEIYWDQEYKSFNFREAVESSEE